MKLDRLLSIVVLLLNRERETAARLAERFGVTVRTIYRDLEAINEAGIPVVAYPGPGGGYGIDAEYTVDRRLLGVDDIRAIVTALKGLNAAFDDKAMGSALDKIEGLGRGRRSDSLEDRIVIDLFPWGRRGEERELVKALEPAIAERRLVSFAYSSYGREAERRSVEPMSLVFKAYAWYLWGYCRLRGDFRLFKLARMRQLQVSLERFQRRPGAYRREMELPQPKMAELLLRVPATEAARAEEWFGIEAAMPDATSGAIFRLSVPEGEWILSLLLGFGSGIEVLEPASLRSALAERAASVAVANAQEARVAPPALRKKGRVGSNS